MATMEQITNKILSCQHGEVFLEENERSSTLRWSSLKEHAERCVNCREALREYEHYSGATVLSTIEV